MIDTNLLIPDSYGQKYLKFNNSDGKIWVIPFSNVKVGLCLYQPSSAKGIVLKNILPFVKHFNFILKALHIKTSFYSLSSELADIFRRVELSTDYEIAYFGGTPGAGRKITVQLSKGNDILCYCKFTNSDRILDIFNHESRILKKLRESGVTNVPECISVGKTSLGLSFFAQSTTKTLKSGVLHEFGKLHCQTLLDIFERTKTSTKFESSDYWKQVSTLKETNVFNCEDNIIILRCLDFVFKQYDTVNDIVFCLYHGDFTPWNTYIEGSNLLLFDFEYAAYTCPPFMDEMHFAVQTLWLENHKRAEEILEYVMLPSRCSCVSIEQRGLLFLSYLLYITAFYIQIDTKYGYSDSGFDLRLYLIKLIAKRLGI